MKKPKNCQWVEGINGKLCAWHRCYSKARVKAYKDNILAVWVCFTHAAEAEKNLGYQIR